MKNLSRLTFALLVLLYSSARAQLSVSINNTSGSYSITCSTPTINLMGVSNTTNTVVYLWTTPSNGTVNSQSIGATTPGVYTLTATSGTLNAFTTISIGINTIAPVSFVSPTLQTITCTSAVQPQTLTAISPTVNVVHQVTAPTGGIYTSTSYTSLYASVGPGTYTYVLINSINGCSTTKTFSIVSASGFPTFSLTSPQNYTLGCSSKSVAVINITNANTVPTGGPLSYTLMFPGSSGILPSGPLSSSSIYSLSNPGTYTAVVRDNNSLCDTKIPFSVLLNTVPPSLDSISAGSFILSCSTPSTLLKAMSSNTNTSMQWAYTFSPNITTASTLAVSANTALPTSTLVSNFTLTITDNNNLCKTSSIVPIYQNLFPPKPFILSIGNSMLSCAIPSVVLTNASTTGIPLNSPFVSTAPVIGYSWAGPTPQTPTSNSSTYVALTAGVYTLVAKDLNNGCTASTVITIGDNRIYPLITAPNLYTIDCPGGTVTIAPAVTGGGSLSYQWTLPPGVTASGLNSNALTVNAPGTYTLVVTNTVTGCSSTALMGVWACVGINERNISVFNLNVYPNPGSSFVNIETGQAINGKAELSIINTEGRLVRREIFDKISVNSKLTLNIGGLEPGVYFITMRGQDGVISGRGRLIKE